MVEGILGGCPRWGGGRWGGGWGTFKHLNQVFIYTFECYTCTMVEGILGGCPRWGGGVGGGGWGGGVEGNLQTYESKMYIR